MVDPKLLIDKLFRSIVKLIPIVGDGLHEMTYGTFDELKKKELNRNTELFQEKVIDGIEKLIIYQNNIVEILHLAEFRRKFSNSSSSINKDIERLSRPTDLSRWIESEFVKVEEIKNEIEKNKEIRKLKEIKKEFEKHKDEFNQDLIILNSKIETWYSDTTKSLKYIQSEKLELINFQGLTTLKDYINQLVSFFDSDMNINQWYVNPRWYLDCNVDDRKDDFNKNSCDQIKNKLLTKYINSWITKNENQFLVILGDYGLGKTTIVKKLTFELSLKRQKGKGIYIPFLIQFKKYTRSISMGSILKDFLHENKFNTESFYSILKNNIPVFILDGFDEISSNLNESLNLLSFADITRALPKNAKIILTSRTHFFKSKKEELDSLSRINYMFEETSMKLLDSQTTIYLDKFDKEQTQEYSKKRLKKEYIRFNEKISSIYNLPDLITRPVLADLICTEWKYLTDSNTLTIYDLYTTIVESWINRENWRSIDKSEVYIFMEILALKMLETNRLLCDSQEIISYIKEYLIGHKNLRQNIEIIDTNIRTSTFISRDLNGNYVFMHKSFWEYFAARGIISSLNNTSYQFNYRLWENSNSDLIFKFIECKIQKDVLWDHIVKLQEVKTKENLRKGTSLFIIYFDLGFYKKDEINLSGYYFLDHLIGRLNLTNSNFKEPIYIVDYS